MIFLSTRQEIKNQAIETIKKYPQGLRYSELKHILMSQFPDTSPNSIEGYIWDLDKVYPDKIYKAARGLFRHVSFQEVPSEERTGGAQEIISAVGALTDALRLHEEDFYEPFADWLKNELEEVTKVIPLGGNRFKNKWGTPDVIGVYKTKPSHIIKAEPIVVSAEIKFGNTSSDLITAFGQACAYKLFSHKVYLVIPNNSNESEISRIESLCLILGIGLILYDNTSKENPEFEIKCRAVKHEPDLWYVNETLPDVEHELFE